MNYTIYDPATGRILRWGNCPDEAIELQVADGEAYIEGQHDGTKFYLDGVVKLFPQRPFGHEWDWGSKTWVPNLAQAKAAKWEQIKAARSAAEYGGFAYAGRPYDSDAVSVQRINGAVSMAMIAQSAGQPFQIDWTLADNSVVTLQLAQVIELGMTLGQFVSNTHAQARTLRLAIEAATTVSQVEAIAWA